MIRTLLIVMLAAIPLSGCEKIDNNQMVTDVVAPKAPNYPARTAAERARDKYRHPAETLMYFEVQPDHTVVEIWPGSGWYSAVLGPYLKREGQLIAAHFSASTEVPFFQKTRRTYIDRFINNPDVYGKIQLTELMPPEKLSIASPGEADRVLTFRNVHNWMRNDQEQAVFDAAYLALRSGGIFGVVEHRAPPDFGREQMIETGYVTEAYVTQLAINAGFEPAGHSEINANPKDTRIHPHGVWSLPPTLRGGNKDLTYFESIGESDRMTLKFRKP